MAALPRAPARGRKWEYFRGWGAQSGDPLVSVELWYCAFQVG